MWDRAWLISSLGKRIFFPNIKKYSISQSQFTKNCPCIGNIEVAHTVISIVDGNWDQWWPPVWNSREQQCPPVWSSRDQQCSSGGAESSNALLLGVAETNNHPLQTDGELTSSVWDKLQPVKNPFEGMIISVRFWQPRLGKSAVACKDLWGWWRSRTFSFECCSLLS